jgi:hypothetical protein
VHAEAPRTLAAAAARSVRRPIPGLPEERDRSGSCRGAEGISAILTNHAVSTPVKYSPAASGSPFDIGAGGVVVLLEECAAALDGVVGLFGALAVCRLVDLPANASPDRRPARDPERLRRVVCGAPSRFRQGEGRHAPSRRGSERGRK